MDEISPMWSPKISAPLPVARIGYPIQAPDREGSGDEVGPEQEGHTKDALGNRRPPARRRGHARGACTCPLRRQWGVTRRRRSPPAQVSTCKVKSSQNRAARLISASCGAVGPWRPSVIPLAVCVSCTHKPSSWPVTATGKARSSYARGNVTPTTGDAGFSATTEVTGRGYVCPGLGRPRGLCVMGRGSRERRPDLLNRNGRSRLRFTLAAPESGARFARPERHRRSADPQVFMPVGVLVRDADWP
jgi:hypothetical protein